MAENAAADVKIQLRRSSVPAAGNNNNSNNTAHQAETNVGTNIEGLPKPSPALVEINRQTEALALAFEADVSSLHVDAVGILFRLQAENPTYRLSDENQLLRFVKSIGWDPVWAGICLSSLEGRDVGDLTETLEAFAVPPPSFWSIREKLGLRLGQNQLHDALDAISDPTHQRAIVSALASEIDLADSLDEFIDSKERELEAAETALRELRQRNVALARLTRHRFRFDPTRRSCV